MTHDEEQQAQFRAHLHMASYHNADDSGRERALGIECQHRAARVAAAAGWDDATVEQLFDEARPLVAFNELMRRVRQFREDAS